MKKISVLKSTVALFAAAFLFLSNSTNPPNGRTGAPNAGGGNEPLCGGCHAGNSLGFDGTMDINGLPETIQGNTTYPVSVDITKTAGDIYRAGFQLTILDDSNNHVGTVTNTGSKTTVTSSGGRDYIEHNNGSRQFGSENTVSYTFDWTAPADISGDNITVYAVAVLGNGSGTANDYSFTNYPVFNFVSGNPALSASINTDNPICFDESTGQATAIASGGTGSYTYSWSSGGNEMTENNLGAGNYTVTVSSGDEFVVESFSLSNPPAINIDLVQQTDIDCINTSGAANISTSGGTGNLSVVWDNGETGNTAVNLNAGSHSVTATDANNCQEVLEIFINENTSPPIASAGNNSTIDCSTPSIQLDGTASSTGQQFSYAWITANGTITSGANTLTPTIESGGIYTLTVTDNTNGCTASDFVLVTENTDEPTADAGEDQILNCNQENITLDGSGSSLGNQFSYEWTSFDGNILSGNNTLNPVVNASGTYTLVVTNNDNGCTAVSAMQVSNNTEAPLVVLNSPPFINCNNDTEIISSNGSSSGSDFSYLWTTNGGNIVGNTASNDISINAAGTYCLSITNNINGCMSSECVTITTAPSPSLGLVFQNNLNCNGDNSGSISVQAENGSGNYTYTWNDGTEGAVRDNLPAGEFTVTATDENFCTDVLTVNLTEPSALDLNLTSTAETGVNAADGTASATVTGGTGDYTYLWSNDSTSPEISNLTAGTYSLTVTDENDCEITEQININVFDCSLSIVSINTSAALCHNSNGGTATISLSGETAPVTYTWSSGGNEATETGLTAGEYTVTVTDATGCEVIEDFEITAAEILVATTEVSTNNLCYGSAEGEVIVTATGGTMPYVYTFSDEGDGTGLAAGNYSVTVTDANQCQAIDDFVILENSEITLEFNTTEESTESAADGTATVTATGGGTSTYFYIWSDGQNTQTAQGLSTGEYCVTVTDAIGCEVTSCVSVNLSGCSSLATSVSSTLVSCNGFSDGTATVLASGGSSVYSYNWSNGSNEDTQNELTAGTYTVTATDANSCQTTFPFEISTGEDTTLPVAIAQDISVEIDLDGQINIAAESLDNGSTDNCGIANFSLSQSIFTCEDLGENIINFSVIDANGNAATTSATVTIIDTIPPSLECPDNYTVACDGTVEYEITANDACDILSFSYTHPSGTVFMSGTTQVNIGAVDMSGNSTGCTFEVVVPNLLAVDIQEFPVSCNGGNDGEIIVTPLGGIAPFSINITGGISGELSAGIYELIITDADGCSITEQIEIEEPEAIAFEVAQLINENQGLQNGAIVIDVEGGISPYNFAWSGPDNFTSAEEDLVNLSAGDYSLTITDANGCQMMSEVITVDLISSVSEPIWAKGLVLFPNPTQDILNINLSTLIDKKADLNLFNNIGQTVLVNKNQSLTSLNLSNLPSGLYWLKISVDDEFVIRKVIK